MSTQSQLHAHRDCERIEIKKKEGIRRSNHLPNPLQELSTRSDPGAIAVCPSDAAQASQQKDILTE